MIENKKAKNELKVGLGEINLTVVRNFMQKTMKTIAKNIVNY